MKKTSQNDITGAWLVSKPNNEMFEKNWDLIFGKKEKVKEKLDESVEANKELYKDLSRIDVIGQNGNEGIHYEVELNKSTGEPEKKECKCNVKGCE